MADAARRLNKEVRSRSRAFSSAAVSCGHRALVRYRAASAAPITLKSTKAPARPSLNVSPPPLSAPLFRPPATQVELSRRINSIGYQKARVHELLARIMLELSAAQQLKPGAERLDKLQKVERRLDREFRPRGVPAL
jgi:hypothetical protein